jgi:hypothetical protein
MLARAISRVPAPERAPCPSVMEQAWGPMPALVQAPVLALARGLVRALVQAPVLALPRGVQAPAQAPVPALPQVPVRALVRALVPGLAQAPVRELALEPATWVSSSEPSEPVTSASSSRPTVPPPRTAPGAERTRSTPTQGRSFRSQSRIRGVRRSACTASRGWGVLAARPRCASPACLTPDFLARVLSTYPARQEAE